MQYYKGNATTAASAESIEPITFVSSPDDEAFLVELGELGALVPTGGDEVGAVGGEDCVEYPIGMGAHEEKLLAGLGVDGPDGLVGAAEGDLGSVR